jgi:beta-glucosidase/6-phospho-beta-glucosidase/beta-galactosidase
LDPLPSDFLFGVACADHQTEASDPGFPPDVWDWWEQRGEVPQPRGDAVDFWHRFPEFLALAANLGCNAFRFSVSWARVEPRPGEFDEEVLDHYARLAQAVHQHGMEPVVTLCHYTWPMHLEWRGGLGGPGFPEHFARYVEKVRDAVAPWTRTWLTFNEPNDLVVSHSSINRRFAPSAPAWLGFGEQVRNMEAIIRNVFLAHRDARSVLRSGPFGEAARVSLNSDARGFPILLRRFLNWWTWRDFGTARRARTAVGQLLASQTAQTMTYGIAQMARTITLLFDGDWCEMGMLGRLPPYLCPAGCEDQIDFLAFDYYYGVRWLWDIARLGASLDGHFERAPVYAPGLYDLLVYFDRQFKKTYPPKGRPVLIMENGLVDQAGAFKIRGEDPPRDVVDRATYIREHVRQVQRARAAGVDVQGYFVWSLTSNREWGLRFGPGTDFGLYHIDLDGDPALAHSSRPLTIHPTPAVEEYRAIIRDRGVGSRK